MDPQERKEKAKEDSRNRCYECKVPIERRKDSPFATCPACNKKRLVLCHVLKPDSQGFYECKQCSRADKGINKYVVVECPKGDCGQIWVMKNFYNGLANRCPACQSEWVIVSCPGCYKFLCFPAKNQSDKRICYEKRRISCKSCSTNFRYWICKYCAFQVFTPNMSSSKEEHLFVCKRTTCPFYNTYKSEEL